MPAYSFRFHDSDINKRLLNGMKRFRGDYTITMRGEVKYSPKDEEFIEIRIINKIRDQLFPNGWQIVNCPKDWKERYQNYMSSHKVRFIIEEVDGAPNFLIPLHYRPYAWKLPEAEIAHSIVR